MLKKIPDIKSLWGGTPDFMKRLLFRALSMFYARAPIPAGESEVFYVCGAFRNNSGISQGCRLYADELERQGKNVIRVDLTRAMRQPENLPFAGELVQPRALGARKDNGAVIIHANPPRYFLALAGLGRSFLRGRRITAYWAWEKETLPAWWPPLFDTAHQIETPSEFGASVFRKHASLPVLNHPHVLPPARKVKTEFASNGIVSCLYVCDLAASFERKNPLGVLETFQRAFPPGKGHLTFKISKARGSLSPQAESFLEKCAACPDVSVISENLSQDEMRQLYQENDIYLSLHRSEGFGLTIAEALALGLDVVATAHGGNCEFMKTPRSHLVPLLPGGDADWPEPDLDVAARILRELAAGYAARNKQAQ